MLQPWFCEAKLGIFIHWGIYAVDGVAESWAFKNGEVSYADYMSQLPRFTASRYDPREWAALFERAGARYAVLTARHHDGVALWDNGLSVGKDLLTPYAEAMRERDLKVGLYYSLSDWSHPDYESDWEGYLAYRDGQVLELMDRHRPDLLWFDGQWERTEEQWRLGELAHRIGPLTVLNGRMLSHGDYATPEQGMPIVAPDGPWETCLTINDSWGYRQQDTNYKSVRQLVRYFTEIIGLGGNLLLDVGPRADGTIPAEQVSRLEGLGGWIRKHAAAVYGTGHGLPPGLFHGPSTLSADRRTLYLFCLDIPREFVAVRGLRNRVRSVRSLEGEPLAHRVLGGHGETPGMTVIDAPTKLDEYATVLAVELDGELISS